MDFVYEWKDNSSNMFWHGYLSRIIDVELLEELIDEIDETVGVDDVHDERTNIILTQAEVNIEQYEKTGRKEHFDNAKYLVMALVNVMIEEGKL